MKNVLLILLSFSITQVAKYEYPYSLNNQLQFDSIVDSENLIKDYTNIDLIENGKHFIIENKIVILYNIKLDNNTLYNCSINFNNSTNSTKVFLLDNNSSSFIGPLFTHKGKIEEKISSSDFMIEVSMDIEDFYTSQVILESISVYKHKSSNNKIINNVRPVSRNRENPVILVTGFWPPTNEMIRHFSQSIELNPDGWEGDDWEHGGAPVWITGSFDPDLNLTYWGVGNPGPDWNAGQRPGDNLYSDSVIALDADTGELTWHFQFTPNDGYDYDSVQVPVLADMVWRGEVKQLMMWANRNGYFYVLDRTNGEFLEGKPYVRVNWSSGLD